MLDIRAINHIFEIIFKLKIFDKVIGKWLQLINQLLL